MPLLILLKYLGLTLIAFLVVATFIPFFELGWPLGIAFIAVWYFYDLLRAVLAVMILGVLMSVQIWNEANPGEDTTAKTSQVISK